jgi:ParB/RepB/Spo0J family partition protein
MKADTTTTETIVRRFALEQIHVDENARENFDPEELQGLAESIKDTQGVLQPLLGMLMPDGRVKLIAGERRLRATKLAGFDAVDVVLKETVSRKDFLKWNLVENLQRQDLKPLEKAKRIKDMLLLTDEGSGLPVYNRASLAVELGISAESIGKYENLLKAPVRVQKAVTEDGLDYTLAALIGALPASLHERAEKEMVFRPWGGAMKREEAQKHVAERYRRDLRKAQFAREDPALIPDAGACSGCPFFGGNRDDVDGQSRGYTCLNPECFEKKQQAHVDRVAAAAEQEGTRVLGQNMTDRVFQNWNQQVNPSSGYVDLKAEPDAYLLKDVKGKTPKWEKLLAESGVPVVIGFDHEGRVRRLAELKLAVEAATRGEHADKFKPKAAANLETVDDKKHDAQISRAKNKASAAALLEGCGEMLLAFSGQRWTREVRLALLEQVCSSGHTRDDMEMLCKIMQPDLKSVSNPNDKFTEMVALHAETDEKLDALILMARNIRSIRYQGFHYVAEGMKEYCAWAEFDAAAWKQKYDERIKAAEREAKVAIKAKEKPVKKAAKAGKGERTLNAEPLTLNIETRGAVVAGETGYFHCDACGVVCAVDCDILLDVMELKAGKFRCSECTDELSCGGQFEPVGNQDEFETWVPPSEPKGGKKSRRVLVDEEDLIKPEEYEFFHANPGCSKEDLQAKFNLSLRAASDLWHALVAGRGKPDDDGFDDE